MATGFFALLDDIAILMDDVAVMSKVATKKTAGILGDDLAVNAEKASGFVSDREIPVLWKITKGSLLNKLIILPISFLLSAFIPRAITPILLLGGIYLAYEGAEKIFEYFFQSSKTKHSETLIEMTKEEIVEYENKKVKSAIVVDFILSIEIVIIALSAVVEKELLVQISVVTIVALMATIGVYGLVAILVRMDDLGLKLIQLGNDKPNILSLLGKTLVKILPIIIKSLAIIGTIAMLIVSGGIFNHNLHVLHNLVQVFPSFLADFFVGLVIGGIVLFFVKIFFKFTGLKSKH
jgi:uncharacterized protein